MFGVVALTSGEHYFVEPSLAFAIALTCANKEARHCLVTAARDRGFAGGTLLLAALFVAGSLLLGSFAAAYADFRACEILLFCFFLVRASDISGLKKADVLLDITIVSLLIGIAASIVFIDPTTAKIGFNVMLCPLGLYISARKCNTLKFMIILGLSMYIAIASFYRTYWLVVGLSSLLYGSFMLIQLWRRSFKTALIPLTLILGSITLLARSDLLENYFNASQDRYIQSIGKTKDLFSAIDGSSGLKEGDDIRLGYFLFMIDHPERIILPKGLGSRASIKNADPYFDQFHGLAYTGDSGFFYLAYHFGLILSGVIALMFFTIISKRIRNTSAMTKAYVFSGLLVFGVYLISVGDLFVVIQRGAIAGAFGGLLTNRRF